MGSLISSGRGTLGNIFHTQKWFSPFGLQLEAQKGTFKTLGGITGARKYFFPSSPGSPGYKIPGTPPAYQGHNASLQLPAYQPNYSMFYNPQSMLNQQYQGGSPSFNSPYYTSILSQQPNYQPDFSSYYGNTNPGYFNSFGAGRYT